MGASTAAGKLNASTSNPRLQSTKVFERLNAEAERRNKKRNEQQKEIEATASFYKSAESQPRDR